MNEETKKIEAELPEDFTVKGMLPMGVKWGVGMFRDYTMGPLTVEAEARAEVTMSAWVDPVLCNKYYRATASDERLKKEGLERAVVTNEERNTALRMGALITDHQLRYRVTRLGAIPKEDIPAAVGALLAGGDDIIALRAAAEEVDKRVESFRDKNGASVAKGPGAASGGNPADPVNPL